MKLKKIVYLSRKTLKITGKVQWITDDLRSGETERESEVQIQSNIRA